MFFLALYINTLQGYSCTPRIRMMESFRKLPCGALSLGVILSDKDRWSFSFQGLSCKELFSEMSGSSGIPATNQAQLYTIVMTIIPANTIIRVIRSQHLFG